MRYCFFLCLLIVLSCTPTKDTTVDSPPPPPPPPNGESSCIKVSYKNDLNDIRRDQFRMLDVKMEEGCLAIKVSYSGGCEGAEFNLFYQDKDYSKPPPTVAAVLGFTDNDHCRSIVEKTLMFDLTSMQKKGSDRVQILLGGWVEPLVYSY